MKKTVLIDTSSAIILFKTGWMDALLKAYRVGTGPSAFKEMTIPNYPGARSFKKWHAENRMNIHNPGPSPSYPIAGLKRLGRGERECITLFGQCKGTFIILDDGQGAALCRREKIPYVNALLIPRLISGRPNKDGANAGTAIRQIFTHGRYAPWVLDHALTCPLEDLTPFLPATPDD